MQKKIIVNKFGGGILKKDLIPFIEKRIREQLKAGYFPVVVVSALPGVTDGLLKKASGKTPETKDKIVSAGERESAQILSKYLNDLQMEAQVVEADEMILTDDNFGNANILYKASEKNVQKRFASIEKIPVIPGFIGKTKNGKITTLGRGGTDTTACFVGAALRADKIILWKDVEGVMSANPKIVKSAKTVKFISYQEAEEAGKIIHDKAIQYVKIHNTPIEIASLVDPKQKTTVGKVNKTKHGAKIVSYKKDLVLFTISDESKKENSLLSISSNAFFKHKVDIILISNTQYSIQIVADNVNGKAEEVYEEINKRIKDVEMHKVSMVYLVGGFDLYDVNEFNSLLIKMKTDLEISAFLYKNCTRLEAIIKEDEKGVDLDKIINALHKKFIK
jgi:aspartate kinase